MHLALSFIQNFSKMNVDLTDLPQWYILLKLVRRIIQWLLLQPVVYMQRNWNGSLLSFQAWKKRWFVLRSGRLTGDPDVLEYYKNDHAKKPIRVIDLNLCEQVDAGLTFNKKDLEHSFIFDIKTIDRIFYLVADTEEEMNKWVRCICDICGFNPTDTEGKSCHMQTHTKDIQGWEL